MGEQQELPRPPSGVLPNGLLPNEGASVLRVLDSERWLMAEERTAELVSCIQPDPPSEERRNAVADYVKRLVMKCFPCQVFTFGSVPLKTYLPDGDIDLTAFSENQNLKDSWAHQVRDMLEKEEKSENAEFHVKEVQYIQAEVKIIKCLVENIVVDISFNQLGGLCTLCFLDEVDHLISQNHLFKRSIILIKAWCYYESRILGAHHGLISTYALETLVLYIFHVFNNSFAGPLEVLYRFLDFFSKFDWDNFCVSLWGPVSISSLPDVTAEPPRKDGGDLLLSKLFLDACESVYAAWPGGLENHGQSFASKHFNVIDPLRANNNLGRSVSKGNFFRIRGAFAFGAKRLSRLFDCPKEDIFHEVNQFFRDTWNRHGCGQRPDAPKNNLLCSRLSSPDQPPGSESVRNNTLSQNQKSYGNPNNSRTSEQTRREINANQDAHVDRVQRNSKADNFVNDLQGKFFARTQSSPELTDAYGEVSSQPKCTKAMDSGKGQVSSTRVDGGWRKNLESDTMANHGVRTDDSSSARHILSHVGSDASNSVSNSFHEDSGSGSVDEMFASVTEAHMMNQEQQELLNIMTSSTAHGLNGQVHVPLSLAPGHVPLPFSHSMLASLGYAQRKLGNISLIETPWGANMRFQQGLVPSPLSHYFPQEGLASNPEDSIDSSNGNFSSVEMNPAEGRESDNGFWHEQERVSPSEFDVDNSSFEMHHLGHSQQSTSAGYNYTTSSTAGSSSNSISSHQKLSRENRRSMIEDRVDNFQFQENRGNGIYFDSSAANSRSFPSASLSSFRSKTSAESFLDVSPSKSSKSIREKQGRKISPSTASANYSKTKNLSDLSNQVDNDKRECSTPSTPASEVTESNWSEYLPHIKVSGHQSAGFEPAQISGTDPLMPITPVLLGPASRQRSAANSGVLPYTFYATGPPVPIFTIPFYNFPTEAGTSETPANNFNGEEWVGSSESLKLDSLEGFSQLKVSNSSDSVRRPTAVSFPEHKPDILNSDFLSHWKNLQYGRLCQNSRHPPIIGPTPVMIPPAYLQERFPWDSRGRPLPANMNIVNQLMSYGSQLVPVAPIKSVTNRPISVYQHFPIDIPRNRTGTGTYLPNPKPSVRDRHSPSTRRGNYSYDRGDHHGDREGNWNINSKVRSSGRSHNRNQAERQSSRPERLATSERRADRPWGSQRNDTSIAYQTQNEPVRSNSSQSGPSNVAFGMYTLPATNPSELSSNGPPVPSVVMLYPYDHNAGYSSPAEQLEFGSLGPIGFTNLSEMPQLNESNRSSGAFDEHSLHGNSAP